MSSPRYRFNTDAGDVVGVVQGLGGTAVGIRALECAWRNAQRGNNDSLFWDGMPFRICVYEHFTAMETGPRTFVDMRRVTGIRPEPEGPLLPRHNHGPGELAGNCPRCALSMVRS